jgi:hypothetical protein
MRDDDETQATRRLAGLTLALALVVLGFFLTLKLTDAARLEDCFLSGRKGCTRLSVGTRP